MKIPHKIISLACALILALNFLTVISVAGGTGTEADPFIITTAEEPQNINNNVSAHYKLGANIDLTGVDFVPLGNADSGAFTGSFDGNGYTIYDLDVFSGKFAGLFGSNEGIIKNVILENIYVYGTRYIGGVVAHNTALGTVENCKVISGLAETDGGVNNISIGGICGINEGAFNGSFSNGADIDANSSDVYDRAGGICGYWNSSITEGLNNLYNTGNVSSSNYSGGLVGYAYSSVTITNSYNTGNISSSSSGYSGGLVGYAYSSVTITNSYNTGNVFSSDWSGGLVGDAHSYVTITNSYNTGNISSSSSGYSGGLVGDAHSYVTITNSYNTGNISSSSSGYSGGLVGDAHSYVTITNSYNTGNISSSSSGYSYSGGLVGYVYDGSTVTISGSYNTGNVFSSDWSGGLVGRVYLLKSSVKYGSSYNLSGSVVKGDVSDSLTGSCLSWSDMKKMSSYTAWNFDEIWTIGGDCNYLYPVLRTTSSPLTIDIPNKIMASGETVQLTAYKNSIKTTDVTWSVTKGTGTATSNGLVSPGLGMVTVTATDSEGNKANFNAFVFSPKANSITATDRTVSLAYSSIDNDGCFTVTGGTDYIIDYHSNNTDILEVDSGGYLTPVKVGTATITATTAGGLSATQTVTVEGSAKSISLPSTATVSVGSTKKITATTSPNPTTSDITRESSDTSVATVDSEGNVTGLKSGTTIITATTDNGYSDTCTVTVNAPITEMAFETPSLILYTGETFKLKLNITPTNTTDTITYSSSSTSKATVSTAGLVTAKTSTGTVTITATSSSGQKAYCNITIKSWPSVLTTVDSTTTISNRYIVTDADLTTKIKDLVVAKDSYSVTATPSHLSDGKSYFGTGSTVDVYDEYENLVITYMVVVNGDVNGDSVIDVLDASQVALASNGHKTLDGAYAMAADSNSDNTIDITDYQSIVNKAVS